MLELLDWTEHPDDRIRCHSGKAAYEHTFEMPAGECGGRLVGGNAVPLIGRP